MFGPGNLWDLIKIVPSILILLELTLLIDKIELVQPFGFDTFY